MNSTVFVVCLHQTVHSQTCQNIVWRYNQYASPVFAMGFPDIHGKLQILMTGVRKSFQLESIAFPRHLSEDPGYKSSFPHISSYLWYIRGAKYHVVFGIHKRLGITYLVSLIAQYSYIEQEFFQFMGRFEYLCGVVYILCLQSWQPFHRLRKVSFLQQPCLAIVALMYVWF